MNDSDKVLTYEEAKQLCMKAFYDGATYGREAMRYGVNARAHDWDHWLKENEGLFKPEPTVEDVLHEFVGKALCVSDVFGEDELVTEYAAKIREVLAE